MRTELRGVNYPNLISSEDTESHHALRRPISGVYSLSNVKKSESYIDECILELVKKLLTEFSGGEKHMSVFQWMSFCTDFFLD